jgi:hypothetical protein
MKRPLFSLTVAVLCFIVTACGSPAALAETSAMPTTSFNSEAAASISTEVIPIPNDVIRTIEVGNLPWELDELIVASEAVVIGKVSKILAPYLPLPRGIAEANYGLNAVGGPQGQWTINGEWVRDRHNKQLALSGLIKLIG